MTHRYRWMEDEKICLVRYEGPMDGDAFIEADGEIFASTSGPGIRFLFDLRDANITGGVESARKYARWMDEIDLTTSHPDALQAMVVDDPNDTGLTMLLAAIAEPGTRIECFSTLDGACRALGIDPEILENHRDLIPV